MPPDPRVHVGVCAVISHPDNYDRVLFQHRIGQGQFASDGYNTWALPGGWLDFGETPEQAVVREVKEELGIDVVVECQLGSQCNLSQDGAFQIVTLFFGCEQTDHLQPPKIMEPEKVDALRWMQVDEAWDLPLMPATKRWIDYYYHLSDEAEGL